MRLIQLNLWHGYLKYGLVPFLQKHQPDFLLAQECDRTVDYEAYFFNTNYLVNGLGIFTHQHFMAGCDLSFLDTKVEMGNAIFARHPLTPQPGKLVAQPYQTNAILRRFEDMRDLDFVQALCHATTNINGKQVHLLSYHGALRKGGRMGHPDTDAHCAIVADYVRQLTGPIILSGDFNLYSNSTGLQPINAVLQNLCLTYPQVTTRNQFSFRPEEVVDYIFISPEVQVRHFEVAPDIVSDHQALILDFDILA